MLLFDEGTVCKHKFSKKSVVAICKELGFSKTWHFSQGETWRKTGCKTQVPSKSRLHACLQPSEKNSTLDDIDCSNESWSSCTYKYLVNSKGCHHKKNVLLTCDKLCRHECGRSCPAGQHRSDKGYCKDCPANTFFVEESASLSCTPCPFGSVSQSGGSMCKCNPGSMWKWDKQTGASCVKCPPGTASDYGATSCTKCPPPTRSASDNGSTTCVCPLGTEWSWSYPAACVECEEGTFKDKTMTRCEKCGRLSHSPRGSRLCTCYEGAYRNRLTGLCTMCPNGTNSSEQPDRCTCPQGQFWNDTTCQESSEDDAGFCKSSKQNTASTFILNLNRVLLILVTLLLTIICS